MNNKFPVNLPKEGPFKVPAGYFDGLHEKIMSRTVLAGPEGKETVFQVPSGYFDSLPERIAARIGAGESPAPKTVRWGVYYQTAVAACIALLLSVLSVLQVGKVNEPENSLAILTDFDEELLVQEYLETMLTSADDQTGELEQYILNQVDENLLLQEL